MLGRPSDYTPELAAVICQRIAEGQSRVKVCSDEQMPHRATVHRWANEREDFRDMYARAREDQADSLADEIVDIADSDPDPQRARVRVDARKWVAAKLKSRKYGDKVTQEHSGPDGGPIRAEVTRVERVVVDANS